MHSRSLGSMEVLMSSVAIVSETGHRSWQAIKKIIIGQCSGLFHRGIDQPHSSKTALLYQSLMLYRFRLIA